MRFYNPFRIFIFTKYYLKGLVCLRWSKYSEAVTFLQKTLNYAKENRFPVYEVIKYLGIAYWQDKQFEKGKQCLLEAEKMNFNYPERKRGVDSELFFYLGNVYDLEAVKDTDVNLKKSKEYYQLAIKDYKGNIRDQLTDIDFSTSRLIKIDEWFRKSDDTA